MKIEKTQVRQLKKRKFKKLSYLALPKRLFIDNESLISSFLRFQTFVFCGGVACIWELCVIMVQILLGFNFRMFTSTLKQNPTIGN